MKWHKRRSDQPGGPGRLGRVPLEPVLFSTDEEEPRPKLSMLRVTAAIVLVGGAIFGASVGVKHKIDTASKTNQSTWFAPYVDVTLTPTYQFQTAAADPARQTVLGFVVAASAQDCTPSWGTYYSLSEANQSLALSARIAQLHSDGAEPIVSFGGQKNTSLDVACSTPQTLAEAYQSVIDAYHLKVIDLDVEGPALDNYAAERRRAAAIQILQQRAASAHRTLDVWLTLPVEPSGLQDNALSVLDSMFQDRVRLAGINIMAMDFTRPPGSGSTMLDLVEQALGATHDQVQKALPRYGIKLGPAAVWRRLGVTVMIGQNNISGERFTVQDAQGLRSYVRAKGLARLSIWSLNRDQQCSANYGVAVLSNTCSGTPQGSLAFTNLFVHLGGTVGASGASSTATVLRPVAPDKDPANAPYPIWDPNASYVAGYKVVEAGEIYQAKWFTSGQDPAAEHQYSWQSPWELLGPVLPTDHAPVIATPPPGTYPDWSSTPTYVAGARVLYQGLPYEAKWPNQGVPPGTDRAGTPWQPLFQIPGEPTNG